jgi:hypothetical protein
MKKFLALSVLAGLLVVGAPAFAEIGAIDHVPAATLLLPHFEVGLENSGIDVTTLFSVNNASAAPAVAHVTLWTIYARPTLDFDIYLTGYDVVTVNLGDLFSTGKIPRTGPNFDIGDDGISPNAPGEFSDPDAAPGGCSFPLPGNIPANLLTYIRNLHTGLAAPAGFDNAGLCGAPSQGIATADQGVAKGYITIDVVNDCSLLFPGNPGYFQDAGLGIAANDNVLWGDYFFVDVPNAFAQGDGLVHIEAIGSVDTAAMVPDAGFWAPGDYTFYGRYVTFGAIDNREPLATTWAARYFAAGVGAFNADSSIICWRDSGRDDSAFYTCGTTPAPYFLSQNQIVIFDEQENPVVVEGSPFSPPPVGEEFTPCPCASTRASAGDFGSIFPFGWFYMNLNTTTGSIPDPIKQSHVTTLHSALGLYSVGYEAVHLDSALDKTFTVTTAPSDVDLGP